MRTQLSSSSSPSSARYSIDVVVTTAPLPHIKPLDIEPIEQLNSGFARGLELLHFLVDAPADLDHPQPLTDPARLSWPPSGLLQHNLDPRSLAPAEIGRAH